MNRHQRRAQAAQARAKSAPRAEGDAPESSASIVQGSEIFIYGEIGYSWWGEYVTALDVKKALDAIDAERVTVRINSPGGDAFEGVAIYNLLRDSPKTIVVKIDAAAFSAASVIAMAGDEIHMAENALMMIHDPWTIAMGDAADMRDCADVLDKVAEILAITYDRQTDGGREAMRDMMRAETWLTAEEALAKNLIDAVDAKADDDAEETAKALLPFHIAARYRKAPAALKRAQAPAMPIAAFAPLRDRIAAVHERFGDQLESSRARGAYGGPIHKPPQSSAAEQPHQPPQETDMSTKLINEALGLRTDANEASALDAIASLKKDAGEAKTYATQNGVLVTERDEALKRAKAAEHKTVRAEVEALVGQKITGAEVDDQVELAISNRPLFDKMMAQRAPMTILTKDPAGMGPAPAPEKLEHDPELDATEPNAKRENGQALAELVNKVAAQP